MTKKILLFIGLQIGFCLIIFSPEIALRIVCDEKVPQDYEISYNPLINKYSLKKGGQYLRELDDEYWICTESPGFTTFPDSCEAKKSLLGAVKVLSEREQVAAENKSWIKLDSLHE